jgi:Protein of unknown function (DUF4012)
VPAYRHRQQHALHTVRYGPRHFYRHHLARTTHVHQPKAARTARRKHRLWVAAAVVVGLVVVAAVILGISAYRSATSAKNSLESARAVIAADLANKQVFLSAGGRLQLAADITSVEKDADAATADLQGSLGMRVMGHVPYLSTQRNGIISLVADARTTAVTGSALLEQVDALVTQSSGTTVSMTALEGLQRSVAQARTTMAQLDRPAGGLIGPIGQARRDFDTQIAKITTDLRRGDQTLSYAVPFLGADGPRSYLIAGENNAEMRDQGSVLSLALMHAQNGNFSVDAVGSVDNIEPTQAVDVPIPAGTQRVFGSYQPTLLWQSVNATADFPFSAQVMQAMFSQAEDVQVNGVVAMDVPALESLLTLTGPVSVPNIPGLITAQNVATVILHDQYLQYPAGSAQAQRHDNIAAVAKAVVDQMSTEHIDLAALASTLAADVAGRHLIVWDEVPRYESTITDIGASGAIDAAAPGRTFHVAVENSTATKLDYYVEPSLKFEVHVTADGTAFVDTTITVTNDTPAGLGPSFQTGPDGINSFTPGQYVSRVVLWSPRGSATPQSVPESGLRVNQSQVSVLPQQSETVTFATVIRHAVSHGRLMLRFVPQPRLVPMGLQLSISAPGWHVTGTPLVGKYLVASMEATWDLHR